MRTVNRSALVTYSAQQMFELVDDVDSYADFLPWCNRSEVLSRSNNIVEAMVELQKGTITKSFTTRNTLTKYESIDLALLGGPFKSLAGGWTFDQIRRLQGHTGIAVRLRESTRRHAVRCFFRGDLQFIG